MVLKKDKDRMWKQAIDFSHDKALEFTKVMPILEDWKNKKILNLRIINIKNGINNFKR